MSQTFQKARICRTTCWTVKLSLLLLAEGGCVWHWI